MEIPNLIFTVLFSCGVLFGISFIWYTRFYKNRKDRTTNYLTWLLVAFTLNNIQILWVDNFVSPNNCFLKNLHPFLFFVFVVPYFHAFILGYLKIENKFIKYTNFAKIIFAVGMTARIVLSPFFKIGNCRIIGQYVQAEEIAIAILSTIVFIQVIRIIFFKKDLFKDLLSYDKLKWINQFLILGAIVLVFWIIAIIFNFKNYVNAQFYVYYPLRMSSSVLLYWVAYTGSFRNVLTSDRENIRKKLVSNPKTILVETKVETESSIKFKSICDFLEKTECFLNPDISLEQLSEKINIKRTNLSDEINKNAKQNFNDFVNSFRVSKAKLLLKDPDYENYTIDAIGLECGFNSKSTFYNAFKKSTNTTPAVYRQIIF